MSKIHTCFSNGRRRSKLLITGTMHTGLSWSGKQFMIGVMRNDAHVISSERRSKLLITGKIWKDAHRAMLIR